MDGGAWWAAVHGVAKSRARLSDFTFTFHFHALEKEMATHSLFTPGAGGAWWAAVYWVTQCRTRPKRLSSSSSIPIYMHLSLFIFRIDHFLSCRDVPKPGPGFPPHSGVP